MFSSLLRNWSGRRGRQIGGEVGSNININRSIPTSTTLPTSTFTLACSWEIVMSFVKSIEKWRSSVLIEVGEVGGVGNDLIISVFYLPLTKWRGSFPTSLEASL